MSKNAIAPAVPRRKSCRNAGGTFGINKSFRQDIPVASSDLAERFVNGKCADGGRSEVVCDDTEEEALLAMLRKSATSELSKRSTISKLSTPPIVWLAVKRAWRRLTRAMYAASSKPC